MPVDRGFIDRNRASRERIRKFASLSDERLRTPVGEHWTVAIVLAHLAFWDRRAMLVLNRTEQDGKLYVPEINSDVANDLSLPLWAAIPPQEAGRLAIESAEALDQRLETYPPDLLEKVFKYNERWVERSIHRDTHLDEAEAALNR